MARIGERNSIGGWYRCSRCSGMKMIAAQEFFPACRDCNSLGKGWIRTGTIEMPQRFVKRTDL